MRNVSDCLNRLSRGREGVALPVALLALVATALIITTVMLTSATEVTLSAAHQDATRDLYTAEGAIERWVAQANTGLTAGNFTLGSGSNEIQLSVRLLAEGINPTPGLPADSTFSITATRSRGGRQVAALITVANRPVAFGINGAVTAATNLTLQGSKTTISDGSDSPFCHPDSAAEHAIEMAPGATATPGQAQIVGTVGTAPATQAGLVESLFGVTLDSLITRADITFTRTAWQQGNSTVSSDPSTVNRANPQGTPYNWGCPQDLVRNTQNTATACVLDGDQDWYPMVVIDAKNADGTFGDVTVNLTHGQGMLIVKNGNVNIQGNLTYKGVILVEGGFDVRASGGGANSPKIEGAIIGVGKGGTGSTIVPDETHNVTGSPTIRYNRCAINQVANSMRTRFDPFRRLEDGTFGWFEVVR